MIRWLWKGLPVPQPGERYYYKDRETNPWDRWTATVLEVKDGWVRYSIQDTSTESSLTIRDFQSMYRKVAI